ncbi:hypothetical protein ACFQ4M_18170 [Thauera mechernichensis]|uniref:Uncharacterized protein n=1 Tax=Thauera mechernichensis TaxID=82788 RepID=A0ABW3WK96_9RHOO|nr:MULTISPECIES: hypothetical protein [Thauera]ENO82840.1 hypothetical protein B447_02446 [Thauera sp. 27]ENO93735.1 hypothetical protein C662_06267 [Thauera sp. 28]MDG3065269.1 hypothetical protein [Thauera mechernichensis]WBL64354.1 hypothetical protein LQF09_00575 [Thauera sp. WB-2]HAG76275.1 hypothetical protein [Thauera sp.]
MTAATTRKRRASAGPAKVPVQPAASEVTSGVAGEMDDGIDTLGAQEAERKDRHEKVERDSFSMPASEHRRIKALREALGKAGVLVSKSEILRAGLALLAERDTAGVAQVIAALPKVAKGKRSKKH